MKLIQGILPAAVTPLDEDGRFAPAVFERLLEWVGENNSAASTRPEIKAPKVAALSPAPRTATSRSGTRPLVCR